MKKIYIQPAMLTVMLRPCSVVAYSPETIGINPDGEGAGTDFVKSDRGSRGGGYNVWDDDWNK